MKRSTSIAIVVATVLIVAGFAFMFFGVAGTDFDFSRFNTFTTETSSYDIHDSFDSIKINTGECDVIFLPTEKEYCEVVCREESKVNHSVKVVENTLVIDYTSNKKWYDNIGIFWGKTDVTVYLPNEIYKDVKIVTKTGDVELKSFRFEKLSISTYTGDVKLYSPSASEAFITTDTGSITVSCNVSKAMNLESDTGDISVLGVSGMETLEIKNDTGDVKIADVEAGELYAETDTGDVSMKRVLAKGFMSVETDTGDVEISLSDAGEIKVETSTGDVDGTLLSEKLFFAETNTGDISVPRTTKGSICDIRTDTGDIKISVKNT